MIATWINLEICNGPQVRYLDVYNGRLYQVFLSRTERWRNYARTGEYDEIWSDPVFVPTR